MVPDVEQEIFNFNGPVYGYSGDVDTQTQIFNICGDGVFSCDGVNVGEETTVTCRADKTGTTHKCMKGTLGCTDDSPLFCLVSS